MLLGKLLEICILAIIMGLTSFAVGFIPLKMPLSQKQINLASFFSMGIILATALVLAIPEGIEALYQSAEEEGYHTLPKHIGLGLLGGFFLMFLVDNLATVLNSFNIKLKPNITEIRYGESYRDLFTSVCSSSLTLGLTIHAAVDGISLGSSYSKAGEDNSIGWIFFLIIIIHKLPTCFSLSSLLLKENTAIPYLKFHLLIFASITPLSSIFTFIFMTVFRLQNDFIVGTLLVFSGGTFLYVVTHVMLDVLSTGNMIPQSVGSEDTLYSSEPKLDEIELLVSIVGITIPILISLMGEH